MWKLHSELKKKTNKRELPSKIMGAVDSDHIWKVQRKYDCSWNKNTFWVIRWNSEASLVTHLMSSWVHNKHCVMAGLRITELPFVWTLFSSLQWPEVSQGVWPITEPVRLILMDLMDPGLIMRRGRADSNLPIIYTAGRWLLAVLLIRTRDEDSGCQTSAALKQLNQNRLFLGLFPVIRRDWQTTAGFP